MSVRTNLQAPCHFKNRGQNTVDNQADENGWTPLMAATAHHDYEIAKTLAERGADVNAKDHHGYTALRIASLQQSGTIVNILKQHGAK